MPDHWGGIDDGCQECGCGPCKLCKHWDECEDHDRSKRWGECKLLPKMDHAGYPEDDGLCAEINYAILTGPNFGCIRFERKTNDLG